MIIDITSDGGLIRIGSFAILWQNADLEFPGFTTFSNAHYSLEFGEIDQGNGIFITKYDDRDIEYIKPLLQL
jgi:hypothetical protein